MRALVQNGQLVAVYRKPRGLVIDGIQHPSTIFSKWSEEELIEKGLLKFREITPNQQFYSHSEYVDEIVEGEYIRTHTPVPRELEDRAEVNEDGTPMLDEKGEQMITKGLKSNAIDKVKAQAGGLLAPTDWMVIKASEVEAYSVPTEVMAYRAEVRAKSNTIELLTLNCTTLDEFIALHDVPVDAEGNPTGNAPIVDWPEEG